MPFKQIRAFIVRCSPRAYKAQELKVQSSPVQCDDRANPLQPASPSETESVSEWTTERASSWNGEPPEVPSAQSFLKRRDFRPGLATPAQSIGRASPTPQGRALRTKHIPDSTRLRVLNRELAKHLERAEVDLSRKHVIIAEMEEDLGALWYTADSYSKKQLELEEENARLSRLVGLLATSKWRPMRKLKQRLLNIEARARVAEGQIARMKEVLTDLVKERKELGEEAWELWDAILKTGEQAGALHRAEVAMNRLSIRFDFEDSHV